MQRDHLRDGATEGETEEVDLLVTERPDERDRIGAHLSRRDRQLIRDTLGYLIPEAGTAIGDGIRSRFASRSLAREGRRQRQARAAVPAGGIVLESDGAQNRGVLQPVQAAQNAKAAGVRV